ncbi:MAG: nickel pincer cofactor biosynthesis protein LarC [Deltaproteobacteria bacterium]|jgi:pyridinium-3,5-bisthiocarboxylic acid mononucleotide nickel chelatase|nr:nickel pincer cofactor biosynthesis protein LarC [Deltaproteobacteria bacterium]
MKTLYFDCFSGISGDMTIAALIDLGVDSEWFLQKMKSLPFLSDEVYLEIASDVKKGVKARTFKVIEKKTAENHRSYKNIKQLINSTNLKPAISDLAISIFEHIAIAESKIHNKELDQVHFHEIGAIDSIVDIVGASLLIDKLNPEKIVCSPITLGFGTVKCQHGIYPVPAMATLEILKSVPVLGGQENGELTTPTGAAIVKTLADCFEPAMPKMTVHQIGYGAGTKDLKEQPNILRIVLGDTNIND